MDYENLIDCIDLEPKDVPMNSFNILNCETILALEETNFFSKNKMKKYDRFKDIIEDLED